MFKMGSRVLILLVTFASFHVSSALAVEKDQALWDAAQAALPEVLKTITDLVQIDSGSNDANGLSQIANVLDDQLLVRGFTTQRHTSVADVFADTVVGTRKGNGTQNVLLMAHMDTVYAPGILQSQPIRREGNQLYGPGTADAKGGIALILHAIDLLDASGWTDYKTLTILFNPDEEIGSTGSGPLITRFASDADTVLSFEPGGRKGLGDWALTAMAEYVQVTMEVIGRASHAGTAPGSGANAAIELAHRILQTKDVADDIQGAQLSWTNIVADQAYNQIPARAVAIADVRITADGARELLENALIVKLESEPLVAGTTTTVKLDVLRPGFRGGEKTLAVATLAQEIHREVAFNNFLIVAHVKGASDAGYAAVSGSAAVLEGFGLSGGGYHSRDEYIEIDSISRNLYIVSRLLIELGRQQVP